MSMNNNSMKRKTRISTSNNINSKPPRTKGLPEKTITCEGIYNNPRFMHAAASLVGCLVQIQVKTGNLYEGVFTTFSQQLDIVLEMVNTVDKKSLSLAGASTSAGTLLASFNSEDSVTDKMIFKLEDIVMMNTTCVDLDYATREGFTDTAISKANGPVSDKELEPWEAPSDDLDGIVTLEGDEEINGGWDVNEMFRTNAEKYNVKSTYDSSLQGYTIPLEPKNTEEYKKQEAKASKIACEIESSPGFKHRCSLENGDEEDRFSAVVRPSDNSNRYASRKRNVPSGKVIRSTLTQMQHHNKPQHLSYAGHGHSTGTVSHSYNKISNFVPTSTTSPSSGKPSSILQVHPSQSGHRPNSPRHAVIPQHAHGGESAEKDDQKQFQGVQSEKLVRIEENSSSHHPSSSESSTKQGEKRRDERKGAGQRGGRDEEIAAFKKFSSDFKLSEDNKSPKDEKDKLQSPDDASPVNIIPIKDKDKDEKDQSDSDTEKMTGSMKKFILNPNAKAFTPRALPVATPPTSLPPPRMHTQSPVVAVPQHQLMAGMGQPIFTTMTPQYVMSATPVSMSLTPPFASVSAAPRYRKLPMTVQPRHDFSPSVHVAAATGQPICQVAPPLTVQYTPTQGMVHAPGPHQAAMAAYPQVMYPVVGPRVMSPQPMGLVPTSHAGSYADAHMPQLFIMSNRVNPLHCVIPDRDEISLGVVSPHPGATALAHQVQTMVPQGTGGPHSNQATPQSQMHTAPSPVHQAPNTGHPTPSQTPTPAGHQGPQPVVYHGQMGQPQMQPGGHHSHTPPSTQTQHINQAHPHYQHSNFTAGPQHLVFMHQQSVPSSHAHTLQGHTLHGQAAAHMGAHTHVMTPASLQNSPYVPHPQGITVLDHSFVERVNFVSTLQVFDELARQKLKKGGKK